ncbi:transcriptional regulator NrdR [bacterium]|nr:transcriptional regulator NrdR [bacterium]MBU1073106.1 transcriptional regulator NrdR [bacterium]MBU1674649.1 transcriptional regulator NrdR [bacterium]
MKCPLCGADDDKVVDSRSVREGLAVRRRRECTACHERFTTYEYIEAKQFRVIKRNGQRVEFDRAKIIGGIARACEKRPVTLEQMEAVADAVERDLASNLSLEVPSGTVGELVMKRLRDVDEVAYVRFASVYRSFKDVDEFMRELRQILAGKEGADG